MAKALKLAVLVGWLGASLSAQPLPEIKQAYAKAAYGAHLKFVYGMLGHRTPDYELLQPDGRKFDLTREREDFSQMFGWADRVDLQVQILRCQPRGEFVQCRVEQVMSLEGVVKDKKTSVHIRTDLDELWVSRRGRWRLRASRVLSQACDPPLAAASWR